jgi:cyclophilin family peptidyl-prolyl cis-trans isomerase
MDFNLFQSTNRSRNAVFVEVFDDRPLTHDNFLAYVNSGKYDATLMHRLARGFVLQGGGYVGSGVYVSAPEPLWSYIVPVKVDLDGNPNTANPTVPNEFNLQPPRSNVVGTLAMAKLPASAPGGGPNSATSEFFFNLANNGGTSPNGLDYQNGGFTVFAKVVGDGMNLISGYNSGLNVLDLNPDTNGNGVHDSNTTTGIPDSGPFNTVPASGASAASYSPLVLVNADQIDYLGPGLVTTIPEDGLPFLLRDAFIDNGTSFVGTDELIVGANRTLGVREGNVLAGRSVQNLGRFEPGLQIGSVALNSFRQDASGTLEIQISGPTADTLYDKLVVSGGVQLGGTLDVTRLGYNPQPGNTFNILSAGLIIDTFDEINLFQLGLGLVWNYEQTSTAITLKVEAADFDRDGVVSTSDYVLWSKNRNLTVSPYTRGDGDGDGVVDDDDYTMWRRNFGNTRGGTGGGSTAPVPEPTSGLLILSAVLVFSGYRPRRPLRSWTAAS